ncbi:AMP-binding protein [Streptomyces sanglieri]|uniref:AMP-binding protein n=1 Tax=Streptomyces sanglieri TaxID=193460 RepID=UPI0035262FD2
MAARSERWADIAVRYRGEVVRSAGHWFAAIGRKELLRLLAEYDLVVAADGANSAIRSGRSDAFGTSLDTRSSRYIWLAVDRPFDALTFLVAESGHGALHGHTYPFSAELSTFIVEADEHAWRAAGLAGPIAGVTPGGSDRFAVERLEEIFADTLDGHRLTGNRSRWRRFTVVRNRRWHQGDLVLLGDAAHTTHFSIGSGTRLAMEDALVLAGLLRDHGCLGGGGGSPQAALVAYEQRRGPAVAAAQRAAQAGLEWFEGIGLAMGREASQFAFELLTRGGRLSCEDLTAAVRSSIVVSVRKSVWSCRIPERTFGRPNSLPSPLCAPGTSRAARKGTRGMSSLTSPDLPADLTLPRLFEKTVARFGARTALVYKGEHFSYAELNSLANKAARSLRQGEVGQGTPVGLHLNRSVELYVMMLAVLKAGGCVVPLNPAHPERVINDVLDAAAVRLVVHQGDHIRELRAVDVMEQAEPLADSDPETEVDAESTAFIMFTSGSTGRPKGVRIPHRGLARLAAPSEELRIDEQDCFVQQAAFSFAASTIEIWQSLLHGAKLVVLPPGPSVTPHA